MRIKFSPAWIKTINFEEIICFSDDKARTLHVGIAGF